MNFPPKIEIEIGPNLTRILDNLLTSLLIFFLVALVAVAAVIMFAIEAGA